MLPRMLCCATLGVALMIGCEKKEEEPVRPPGAMPTPEMKDTATDVKDTTSDAADKAADAAGSAADTAANTAADAAGAANATANDAANTAAATGSDMSAEASKLIDQAMTYIKENKWDLAESTVSKLEGMKASLSPALQTQVDNARKALDAGKAAGGVKLPGM